MKIKIDSITEAMFAQAVALTQSGRMKNTIHVGENKVFIKNMDNTILIQFTCDQKFPEDFSFFANDYESDRIRIEGGKIVFITNQKGIRRKKVCPAPETTFNDVQKIWEKFQPNKKIELAIESGYSVLLEDGLSHVEFSKEDGEPLVLIQRDIYTGSRVEVQKNKASVGFSLQGYEGELKPIGVRTSDFKAFFTFTEKLQFYFQPEYNWIYIEDYSGKMKAILSTCLYDEIGYLAEGGGK